MPWSVYELVEFPNSVAQSCDLLDKELLLGRTEVALAINSEVP